jgi:hypothetical protein
MRIRGGRVAALTAVLLLAAGACTSSPPEDDEVSLDNRAVSLTRPELKIAPTGAWALTASFAWDACGERACFALENRRHGGPDVFGVFLENGPALAVQTARLTLHTSCDRQTILSDARTSETGGYFLVQEATGPKGSCERFGTEREFNMASGELEVVVTQVAGATCQATFAVTALFGHSSGDAGRKVQVAAGRAGDNPKIEWGDNTDDRQVFTALPSENGIYDCAGKPS